MRRTGGRVRGFVGLWLLAITGLFDWWMIEGASLPWVTPLGAAGLYLLTVTCTVVSLAFVGWLWRYDGLC